ncbi:alpha/beta hydrolase family esterase [Allorhizobium sonneratiae]|uniref:alpha/beta hydrolase family esterase n=1 Tax=Allorhizobium sonneratiae TaxID=2934936 RepID=UPI0020333A24|nr:polyhydroxybutyrate depolymerase [Allorhizobium sonneratiae]
MKRGVRQRKASVREWGRACGAWAFRALPGVFVWLMLVPVLLLVGGKAQAAGCGLTVKPGFQDVVFSSGGLQRKAVIFVPPGYSGKLKVPVVFDLHGSNSFPRDQFRRSHWPDIARQEGFIVVAPQGGLDGKLPGTHAWNVPGVTSGNGPDDVAYLQATLDLVKDRFCVDPDRIYASGYSGGGRMLSQFICNGNGDFSAAAFVMSLRAGKPVARDGKWLPDPTSCKPSRALSIIAFWGMKDHTNPYAGGGRPYWQYGGETALYRWAELDGCKSVPSLTKGVRMSSMAFDRCRGGVHILSYTIADQTHDWPDESVGFSMAPLASTAAAEPVPADQHASSVRAQKAMFAARRMWAFFSASGKTMVMANAPKADCTGKPAAGMADQIPDGVCAAPLDPNVKPAAVESHVTAGSL